MKYFVIILCILFFGIGYVMSLLPAESFLEIGSILAVVMISLPAFYGMWRLFGKRGVVAVIALGVFALAIETIGIHTGFPYSLFEYTMPFGYRLFNATPWTVFIAWSPLVIGAFILSHYWFHQWWSRLLIYLGLLLATDSILDPGAVARGLWEYNNGGVWYGVPLENFFGWIFSGVIAYGILKLILKIAIKRNKKILTSQKNITITSLSLLFSLSLWTGVNLGYELWLPFFIGMTLSDVIILGVTKKPAY